MLESSFISMPNRLRLYLYMYFLWKGKVRLHARLNRSPTWNKCSCGKLRHGLIGTFKGLECVFLCISHASCIRWRMANNRCHVNTVSKFANSFLSFNSPMMPHGFCKIYISSSIEFHGYISRKREKPVTTFTRRLIKNK